jgi:ferric-dicitrate binding protein FerR (iron transport regulator)
MVITAASIAPFVPIIQLLGKIIGYLTELQKNSKKHSEALAEIKNALAQMKKMLEEEIEARKKEQELSAADRALTRKLLYWVVGLACSPWIYIGLHVAGFAR